MIVLYRSNFVKGFNINTLLMSSFYITFCEHMKHVLHVRVCSVSTKVTPGHGIILMLSSVWAGIFGDIVMGLYLLPAQ
jgi:hypothetical protein